MARVLLVHYGSDLLGQMSAALGAEGHDVRAAATLGEALGHLSSRAIEVMVADVDAPTAESADLVAIVRSWAAEVAVIVTAAAAAVGKATVAVSAGAFDYLVAPFSMRTLLLLIAHASRAPKAPPSPPEHSDRFLESVLNALPNPIFVASQEHRLVFVNDGMCASLGRPRAQIVGKSPFELFPREQAESFRREDNELFATGTSFQAEHAITLAPGKERWHLVSKARAAAPDGSLLLVGVVTDVTERKRMEDAIRQADKWTRTIIATAPVVLWSTDENSIFTSSDGRSLEHLGLKPGEVVGQDLFELYRDYPLIVDAQRRALGGEDVDVNVEVNGIAFECRFRPVCDPAGKVTAVIGVALDLTERRRAEEDLLRAHRATFQLLSAIPSMIIALDEASRVTLWSAVAEKAFGLRAAQVLGRPFREVAIPWQWSEVERHLGDPRSLQLPKTLPDLRYTRADGQKRLAGFTVCWIWGDSGQRCGQLWFGADVTERRKIESELQQTKKLESLGRLAAGIAHEINTPIQYVGDNTTFLQEAFRGMSELCRRCVELIATARAGALSAELITELEDAIRDLDIDYLVQEVPTALAQSLEGIERVATIVRAMKDFSHPGNAEKRLVDINRAIRSTVEVSRNEWKYVADSELDLDPALPPVPCLPGELNQVLLNIIVNAAGAIADSLRDQPGAKGTIAISTNRRGEWVEIRIRDTGTGIPEPIRDKIFDPFFTTKEVGSGTGQGLTLARTIVVDRLAGSLTFESEVGKGTTFIIKLAVDGSGEH
ncbi:MAG: PAS domain-containing protein [Candidatus Schekmanbacteria bacterium]|nr:PAS domain-containing protein [Candidatus Schekmanbacteria bacterium]